MSNLYTNLYTNQTADIIHVQTVFNAIMLSYEYTTAQGKEETKATLLQSHEQGFINIRSSDPTISASNYIDVLFDQIEETKTNQ